MKKTLQRAGAVGLATVTIVTGLSFGPAATAAGTAGATPSTRADVAAIGATVVVPDAAVGTVQEAWTTITFRSHIQGIGYFTAPPGTTIVEAEVRMEGTDAVDPIRTDLLKFAEDRRTLEAWGTAESGDNMHWGPDYRYLAVTLQVDATATPGSTLTGGRMMVRRAPDFGGKVTGDQSFSLHTSGLTAVASFGQAATDPVTITGQARPTSVVSVTDPNGVVVGTTTADATTGKYSTPITAPDKAGSMTYTVLQARPGAPADSLGVDVDFGAGVAVTSPVDDLVHPGGPISFTGTGEPFGSIALHEDGKREALGVATVTSDGDWTIPGIDLDELEHTLTVTQVAKGNNTTTAGLTLSPGHTSTPPVVNPFEISSPQVEDGYTSGATTTFTGTGTAGATVSVTNKWGTPLGDSVEVDDEGRWVFARVMTGTSTYNIVFTETTPTGDVNRAEFYGFACTGTIAPTFDVTSPKNTDGYVSGRTTTFTGIGTAGSTVTVTNKWGTSLGSPVVVGTDGTWSFTRVMTGTSTYQMVFTEETLTGKTTTVSFSDFAPVEATFRVTSPATTDGYTSGQDTTFTGIAAPGATITVTNKWNVSLGADVTADAQGNWSFTRTMTGTSTYMILFTEKHDGISTTVQFFGFAPTK